MVKKHLDASDDFWNVLKLTTLTPASPTAGQQVFKALFNASHETFHGNNRGQHFKHLPGQIVWKLVLLFIEHRGVLFGKMVIFHFPVGLVYKPTCSFMKTSGKESIEWKHNGCTLCGCVPNQLFRIQMQTLERMITFSEEGGVGTKLISELRMTALLFGGTAS